MLVTEGLKARLEALAGAVPDERALHAAEAPDRIAWHLSRQIERALNDVGEADRARVGIEVARALLDRLGEMVEVDPSDAPTDPATVLHAILGRRPDGSTDADRPAADPAARHDAADQRAGRAEPVEPAALRDRVRRPDRRRDGVHPSQRHRSAASTRSVATANAGRPLRVLTTTYTGSTEQAALDRLVDLGADVRVSYDLSTTRLHAKAWVFHRDSGFSTAYVGSSNLTHSAQVTGVEWNVRASAARNPDVLDKFAAVFDSYWSSGDFVPYDAEQFVAEQQRAGRTDSGPHVILSPIELRPLPFQERLLELHRGVAAARAPPQPARLGDRHRQDRDGGARLRTTRDRSSTAHGCCSSPTARRSSTRAWRRSATRCATRPSARSGSAAHARHGSSTSSPRSRASTPTAWPTCRPTTSTS